MKTAFLFLAMTTAACTINAMQRFNYSPPKPDTIGLIVQNDTQTVHIYDYDKNDLWWYDPFKDGNPWDIYYDSVTWTTTDIGQHWDHNNGGKATTTYTFDNTYGYESMDSSAAWNIGTPTHWGYFGAWQFLPGNPNPYDYQNHDGYTQWIGDTNGISQNPPLGCEHCDVQRHTKATIYTDYGWTEDQVEHVYNRNAQTTMSLLSGGRGIPGRMILHEISGWVKDVIPTLGVEAQPPYRTVYLGQTTAFGLQPNVPNNVVHLLGGTLHDDPNHPGAGSLYYLTPEGAGPIDATPTAGAMQFYAWSLSDSPHVLGVSANSQQLNSPPIPDFCVGQILAFALYGLPGQVGATDFRWTFNGHYFNNEDRAVPSGSLDPFVDPSQLCISSPSGLWWVSGGPKEDIPAVYHASVQSILSFPNGQPPMKLNVSGPFNMYRPTATITAVHDSPHLQIIESHLNLIFGNWNTKVPGMDFSYEIHHPKKFPGNSGNIKWLQVILTQDIFMTDAVGVTHQLTHDVTGPYLDVTDPYYAIDPITDHPQDSPMQDIPAIINEVDVPSWSFRMTMMYVPSGGGMRVPLRAITWSWNANAITDTNPWQCSGSGGPVGTDFPTEVYPHWNDNVANYSWNPPLP